MTGAARDVIVLAGGRAERLGGASKPQVRVGGQTLLERVLAAASDDAGHPVRAVVVGPAELASTDVRAGLALRVVREDPPFGGPVAGLAAGLAELETWAGAARPPDLPVLVLACDLPYVSTAVGPLLERFATLGEDEDGACAEQDGRLQWLVGAYRREALRRALGALGRHGSVQGASVRALVAPLRLVGVGGVDARDVDTWAEVAGARERLGEPRAGDGPGVGADVAESVQRRGGPMSRELPPIQDWVETLAAELGVDPALVDLRALLDMTRDVAHHVDRPAAPVSAFIVGLAAGSGASVDQVQQLCARTSDLARARSGDDHAGAGPAADR
ncbi:molybdenum cofactor guanylyltransferase [Occultella glacieicola]|uniref:Molybdenum cofactor guanylyltransferase n=1 Tax=Occultella glacieicola TaxID=2518684 RepID=A0ABY2E3V1_9MICO|nr:NTP transferase domain-containing protein [Occultella glacieicola]TDE94180.1 molybdenum cofactor guanylyltransferase [Occultella glacieicola]